MRKVEFRGFDPVGRKWVYGNLVRKDNPTIEKPTHWCSLIHDKALTNIVVVEESIGEFSGIIDSTGKDVYEGDIVDLGTDGVCEVVFELHSKNTGYRIYLKHPKRGRYGGLKTPTIIGNIYQNPELLKK